MESPQASRHDHLRILLTGATGQVGGDLLPLLPSAAFVAAPDRNELDLTNESAIRAFVHEVKPHWIINTAAYTAVDRAEQETEPAQKINAEAPGILGEEAAKIQAAVIHFSTDYVFDGSGDQPWREEDRTGPLNAYGRTKLAGERALAQSGAAHLIFRTSWVYGARGKNFMRTILRHAREQAELRIVADQYGAPTWSSDLAALVAHVVSQAERSNDLGSMSRIDFVRRNEGIFHAAGGGTTSWFGFAQELLKLAAIAEPNQQWASLSPIVSTDYPTAARRPLNSRLACGKLLEVFGYEFPSWEASAAAAMATLFENHWQQTAKLV